MASEWQNSTPLGKEDETQAHTQHEPSRQPSLLPGDVLGRYRLVRLIGRGGMGDVFAAEDTQLKRTVALKVPKLETANDSVALDRFFREAKAAATLDHPQICPVYDVGQAEGKPFIAMGLVGGTSLAQSLQQSSQWPERAAAELVCSLAKTLDYAHRQGVVHRDLKPQNIMLDERQLPVLLDFGLARTTFQNSGNLTQSGMVLGTPAYIAPEQAEGRSRAVGPAADIYSLGVIFYELLTGARPFEGTAAELLGKHLYVTPQPPESLRPGISPRLTLLCMNMLAKSPDARPRTMGDVSRELDQWLSVRSAIADVEDTAGQFSWWLPFCIWLGAIALFYYAIWVATPATNLAGVILNAICSGPLVIIGIGLCVLGSWMVIRKIRT